MRSKIISGIAIAAPWTCTVGAVALLRYHSSVFWGISLLGAVVLSLLLPVFGVRMLGQRWRGVWTSGISFALFFVLYLIPSMFLLAMLAFTMLLNY